MFSATRIVISSCSAGVIVSLIRQRQNALANGRDKLFNATTLTETGNNAGVNTSIQMLVNSKYPIPNSGGSPLSLCVAWIHSLKKRFRHLQNLSSPGDKTNTRNTIRLQLANTINQTFLAPMNAFQPLTSDHEVRNFSTTNYSPSTITITESLIFK